MRHLGLIFATGAVLAITCVHFSASAAAKTAQHPKLSAPAAPTATEAASDADTASRALEVSADQSLEWYQDKSMYVARGNAKAVRGDTVIEADVLMAHQPEKDKNIKTDANTTASQNSQPLSGDIDRVIADGNVRISDPLQRITGGHAVYDMVQHVMVVTGNNLKYETETQSVTARDALEYWEEKRMAVARGHAVAIRGGRHIEGDILTAEFRVNAAGENELSSMTATDNVVIVTKTDVARGERMVYDAARNVAVLNGNVRITRKNGMQLAGDVGEVDFSSNKSRLLNQGGGRVRALIPAGAASKESGK